MQINRCKVEHRQVYNISTIVHVMYVVHCIHQHVDYTNTYIYHTNISSNHMQHKLTSAFAKQFCFMQTFIVQ